MSVVAELHVWGRLVALLTLFVVGFWVVFEERSCRINPLSFSGPTGAAKVANASGRAEREVKEHPHRHGADAKKSETVHNPHARGEGSIPASASSAVVSNSPPETESLPNGNGHDSTWTDARLQRLRDRLLDTQAIAAAKARCQHPHTLPSHDPAGLDPQTTVCLDGILAKAQRPCFALSIGIAHIWTFDDLLLRHNCTVHAVDPSMGDRPKMEWILAGQLEARNKERLRANAKAAAKEQGLFFNTEQHSSKDDTVHQHDSVIVAQGNQLRENPTLHPKYRVNSYTRHPTLHKFFPAALGVVDGVHRITDTGSGGPNAFAAGYGMPSMYRVLSLATLMATLLGHTGEGDHEVGDHHVDVVRMDCEGAEWGVLERALDEGTLLDRIDQLLLEVHFDARGAAGGVALDRQLSVLERMFGAFELFGAQINPYGVGVGGSNITLGAGGGRVEMPPVWELGWRRRGKTKS